MYKGDFNVGNVVLHFIFLLLPAILGWIYVLRKKPRNRVEAFFILYLIISVGLQGLVAGIWQICAAYKSPPYMGWHYNPFLFELGMANLAFGILGVMATWVKEHWRGAAVLGYALFLFLSSLGHLVNFPFLGRMAGNPCCATLWTDLVLSIILFVLLRLRRRAPVEK